MIKRIVICGIAMMVLSCVLYTHLLSISLNEDYAVAGEEQFYYDIDISTSFGSIYDCKFNPLVNDTTKNIAVVNPTDEAISEVSKYVLDTSELEEKISMGIPFAIEVSTDSFNSKDISNYVVPNRYSSNQLAKHTIGYTVDNVGVSGLELSYNDFLHQSEQTYSVKLAKDGLGNVLQGIEPIVSSIDTIKSGIVTTIDKDIQSICEYSMRNVDMGACIVTDVSTGEIKAMVSMPSFDIDNLAISLNDNSMPFINRSLCAYSCGSIFKLITSGVALEYGIDEGFSVECTGRLNVFNQKFNCHNLNGHGVQSMRTAMKNSCNTYFIELSQYLPNDTLLEVCDRLGFGRETIFAKNIVSQSGYLPTENQLNVPAEKANFSFGQGYLTVTPIQISSLTCAIANDGVMPILYLVKGKTNDGYTIYDTNEPKYTPVFSIDTAKKLQDFMNYSVQYNSASKGRPYNNTAGGKTSTAQTGRYNPDGSEVCQAWITGYFPCLSPKYAVTVLVENGDYGNNSCAPIFKQIIELITEDNL